MNESYNVFISWSGPRSEHVATYLREWLSMMVHYARPWISTRDIDKGAQGLNEIRSVLADIKVGICCLTPENVNSPWILYEAGALTKTVDHETRLCTYLLGGLTADQIRPPLGMFQHTYANKGDTRRLIHTINKVVSSSPLPQATLDGLFDKLWPDLEAHLQNLPNAERAAPPKRGLEEMVAEILDLTRASANASSRAELGRRRLADPRGEAEAAKAAGR